MSRLNNLTKYSRVYRHTILCVRNFSSHDSSARNHGTHFFEGNRTRQIFEAAVRCHNNLLGRYMRQCAPDARSDGLRCLDGHVRQVERAEDYGLARELFQHRAVEAGLSSLDRHLLDGRIGELWQE